jgi:ubiquinone/menaquinone biosynthesis C-methylase UbiE
VSASTRSPEIEILACARCGGDLDAVDDGLHCLACDQVWPTGRGFPDFLAPAEGTPDLDADWSRRQEQMVAWYEHFEDEMNAMIACFKKDYASVAADLERVRGRVLDLGGGAGVTRAYLPEKTEYINLDPSDQWLDAQWSAIARALPAVGEPMAFVRGVGEKLPFADRTFDSVVSLWSLNHASSAEQTISECARVLRPSGTFLMVLEDMEPDWRDLPRLPARRPRTLSNKVRSRLTSRPWPVQSDHTALTEPGLQRWVAPHFSHERRRWTVGDARAPYLVLDLRRSG